MWFFNGKWVVLLVLSSFICAVFLTCRNFDSDSYRWCFETFREDLYTCLLCEIHGVRWQQSHAYQVPKTFFLSFFFCMFEVLVCKYNLITWNKKNVCILSGVKHKTVHHRLCHEILSSLRTNHCLLWSVSAG